MPYPSSSLYPSSTLYPGSSPYVSTVLATTGLVAYYRLEEAAGGFVDAKAAYADGTVVSTITRGATGIVGNAIEISGKAGAVDLPQALRSGMTAQDNWSLEAWLYPTALPSTVNGGMAVMWGDGGGGYGFGIFGGSDAGGSKLFVLYESEGWHDSGYTFPATHAWYHVVTKRQSGTLKYFVNATQTANTYGGTPSAPSSGSSAPRIGSRPSSLNFAFTGRLDEVAFYNAAISDADIAAHYAAALLQELLPAGIASAEAFGDATIGNPPVAPTGIASAEAFGTLALTLSIAPTGIASAEAFGALTIHQPLAPTGITSSEAFGTLTLGLRLTPAGISSAEAFGTLSLSLALAPTAIASSEGFGVLTLSAPAPDDPEVAPRDIFYDDTNSSSYEWTINHAAEDTTTLSRSSEHSAPNAALTVVRQQSASGPQLIRLHGTVLDPAQRTSLEDFFTRCEDRILRFHDAEGDEYEVTLTSLDIHAEKVGINPRHPELSHIWRVSLEMLILGVLDSQLVLR